MEAFILILVIAGVGMTIAAVKSAGDDSDAVWKAASQRLGLRFEHTDVAGSPIISGNRRGLSVRIDTYAKSGDNSRTYTRYRVSFKKSLGLGLQLTRQGPLSKVAKKLGTQDILTGDQDFDDAVVVKGRDPQKVADFLTPVRRLRAARFLLMTHGSTIDDVKIESETREKERSPDRLVQMIQQMTSLAESLTAETHAVPDYLTAKIQPDETETNRHFIGLPYHPEPGGPFSLEDLLEVESEPAEVPESPRLYSEAPEAIEAEPSEHDENIPEESEATEPQSFDEVGPNISTVVETLFALGQTTSKAAEIFDIRFKDQAVAWSGTLTNVRSFRFDSVFGDVPGTRAEFDLRNATDPPAVGRVVKAVVQFPTDVEEKLRALVDHRLMFRGILISCDAFIKTLFLTDGEIGEVDG